MHVRRCWKEGLIQQYNYIGWNKLIEAVVLDCTDGSGGWSCCTSSNQCGEGEGDCDSDADCSGNLKCGQGSGNDGNCDTSLGFPATYDCCYAG